MNIDYQHEMPFHFEDNTLPIHNTASGTGSNTTPYQGADKWTLMIAPTAEQQVDIISGLNLNKNHVIAFPRRHCQNVFSTLKTALKCNNCSTVVIWPGILDTQEMAYLKTMAVKNNVVVIAIDQSQFH
jgi:cell division inhibitor SulA